MHDHIHIAKADEECPPPGGYCRTHELNILLLAALYAVSRVLSRSLAIGETLREDRKSTRLNSSHLKLSRMPSSA